jgi:hypothetical protein
MRTYWITAALVALASGLAPGAGRAQEHDAQWVTRRVAQIKNSEPTAWKQIPWESSLTEARRVGRKEGRTVFLFTHDGNLETGRC